MSALSQGARTFFSLKIMCDHHTVIAPSHCYVATLGSVYGYRAAMCLPLGSHAHTAASQGEPLWAALGKAVAPHSAILCNHTGAHLRPGDLPLEFELA